MCPVVLFCGWGAAEVSRGGPHAVAAPATWTDLLAPVQRESRTVRPISLAFLGVQQTVVRQSTRATSVDRAASAASSRPYLTPALQASRPSLTDLKAAPSNASAASESTTAGSLEAFSQGIADAERF